jgi:hypothetical protein
VAAKPKGGYIAHFKPISHGDQVTMRGESFTFVSSKTPKALDAITDKVLRYRPKPKSKAAKRRKRRAKK